MGETESTAEEETEEVPRRRLHKNLQESVQRVKERLETLSKETEAEEKFDAVKEEVDALAKDIEKATRESPVEAAGVCLLAGLAVGILLGVLAGKKND